jgi:hypothetical protein
MQKNYQEKWNDLLQAHVPNNVSLAKELSELLDISLDSAYRRLRNETDYSLEEAAVIANHFNLPLEALNNERHAMVSFKTNQLTQDSSSYQSYLKTMLESVKYLHKFENSQIYFGAEDIPVFYHYGKTNLMKFKIVYWLKSLLLVDEFQNKHVEEIELDQEMIQTAEEIYNAFTQVNSLEVWTHETVLSTIKQIRFYWEAGFFKEERTVKEVLDDLESVLQNIQRQAELGQMLAPNGSVRSSKYTLYISDVMIGTNSIIAQANELRLAFISYNTFNFMQTGNQEFTLQSENWMNNLISRSTLVSGVSERIRNQFFKSMYRQIHNLKAEIDSSL